MTFSLVVAVPTHQLLGVASASRSLAVGHSVPALVPGVGAVASQSWTNRALRSLALDALERGDSPAAYVAALPALDPDHRWRQVGVVDAAGAAAGHTGAACSAWAGECLADGADGTVLALGNLLTGPVVVEATAAAAASRLGDVARPTDLATVLVDALAAGQDGGGDRRGQQSATVLVGSGPRQRHRPPDLDVDLRVDDADRPIDELARLLGLRIRSGGLALRPRTE
jgi:uncharacterized Ntn-hydrolase superfamily protein